MRARARPSTDDNRRRPGEENHLNEDFAEIVCIFSLCREVKRIGLSHYDYTDGAMDKEEIV